MPPPSFAATFASQGKDSSRAIDFQQELLIAREIRNKDLENGKTKKKRDKIWANWQEFAAARGLDDKQPFVDLCMYDSAAVDIFLAFLNNYVKNATKMMPQLDSDEYVSVSTIDSARTVHSIWGALLHRATKIVLEPARKGKSAAEQALLNFRYGSARNLNRDSPAYLVASRIYLLDGKRLSTKQMFKKEQVSADDILVLLYTLWLKAVEIRCSGIVRLGFHIAVVLMGIGGFRPQSVLNLAFKDCIVAWMRDPKDPSRAELTVTFTITHEKEQEGKIDIHGKDRVTFSVLRSPTRQNCLFSHFLTMALAQNAFQDNITTWEQLQRQPEFGNTDYCQLRWRDDVLEEKCQPLCYNTFWKIWNRLIFVSGIRNSERLEPYAVRRGTGKRLEGSMEPSTRNFILNHSEHVHQTSYQFEHIQCDLMQVAFGRQLDGAQETIKSLSSVLARRDVDAPIHVSRRDLESFEARPDLCHYRRNLEEATAAGNRKLAEGWKYRINYLLDCLVKLKIRRIREQYFEDADRSRASREPPQRLRERYKEYLTNPRPQRDVPGSDVAPLFAPLYKGNVDSIAPRLLAFVRGGDRSVVFPDLPKPAAAVVPESRCLLCGDTFSEHKSLTRHFRNKHLGGFTRPIRCPECCHKGEVRYVSSPDSWCVHVRTFHGRQHAPKLQKLMVRCPYCQKEVAAAGATQHFNKMHPLEQEYPSPCPECPHTILQSSKALYLHLQEHLSRGGAVRAPLPSKVPEREQHKLCELSHYEAEQLRPADPYAGEEFWVTGREELDI